MNEADTRPVTHLLRDTSSFKIGTRGDFFSFRFLSCFPVLRCRNFRSAYLTVVLGFFSGKKGKSIMGTVSCYSTAAFFVLLSSFVFTSHWALETKYYIYIFLSVWAVFPCVQTMVWLTVFGIFNVPTDVDACDSTRGLYGHRQRVSTEIWLWGKISCRTGGSNPCQYCAWLFNRML